MNGVDFGRFEALTFDCYGTLIDWESGILAAIRPILDAHGAREPDDERILERFGSLEADVEAGPFRPYRAVLTDVANRFGGAYGFTTRADEAARFAASVATWPPFPDSAAALGALGSGYRLAVVSNIDDDLFSGSAEQLGATFDEVVTAQQVGSYKPAPEHFHEVLRRLDLPPERVLHVAQSLYHDIGPARQLGFTCVWLNRRAARAGGGATRPSDAVPDLEVPDLASLVAAIGI